MLKVDRRSADDIFDFSEDEIDAIGELGAEVNFVEEIDPCLNTGDSFKKVLGEVPHRDVRDDIQRQTQCSLPVKESEFDSKDLEIPRLTQKGHLSNTVNEVSSDPNGGKLDENDKSNGEKLNFALSIREKIQMEVESWIPIGLGRFNRGTLGSSRNRKSERKPARALRPRFNLLKKRKNGRVRMSLGEYAFHRMQFMENNGSMRFVLFKEFEIGAVREAVAKKK